MTKEELLKRIKEEDIALGPYILILDKITDSPLVFGCTFDEGMWKIFETRERGGHFLIKKFSSESDAFEYFYQLLIEHSDRIKKYSNNN